MFIDKKGYIFYKSLRVPDLEHYLYVSRNAGTKSTAQILFSTFAVRGRIAAPSKMTRR
jgi:hypothetical protein